MLFCVCVFPSVVPSSGVRCSSAPFLLRGDSNLVKKMMDGRDQTLWVLRLSPAPLVSVPGSVDPGRGKGGAAAWTPLSSEPRAGNPARLGELTGICCSSLLRNSSIYFSVLTQGQSEAMTAGPVIVHSFNLSCCI